MKKHFLISFISLSWVMICHGQTLFLPTGVGGIGTSTNGNIGVGTGISNPSSILTIIKTPTTDEAHLFFGNPYSETTPGQVSSRLCFAGSGIQNAGFAWVPNTEIDGKLHLAFGGHTNPMNNPIKVTFQSNGNVGIGTMNPSVKLQIGNYSEQNTLRITGQTGSNKAPLLSLYRSGDRESFIAQNGANLIIGNSGGLNDYNDITLSNSANIAISSNGNIGIGTTCPQYKLDVAGTVRADEVKVDLTRGCDFVFKRDYKLVDLKILERYVQTNQHLPEIASEKEMIENGVNMKDLQMKLLQKIEELTLYTIEQNKKIETLEKEMKEIRVK